MDYESYLNEIGSCRKPSPIRCQIEKFKNVLAKAGPKPIYLSGGLPNADTFPTTKASFRLRDGTDLELDEDMMEHALQYDTSPGNTDLLKWVYELQSQVHNPPTYNNEQHHGKMECIITCGAQHGLSLIFEDIVSKGDYILIETPTYPGVMSLLLPMGPQLVPVEADEHGIIPSKLRETLSRWNPATMQHPGKDGPKLLYCVPNCGNPTGASLTLERKKEIYQLAREYKFIIVEDDPYFFLKTKPYTPSFLSIDEDGRVLRADSMSKIISAGIRIGILSGPSPLMKKIKFHVECTVQTASGLSQQYLLALLQKWGHEGFYEHTDKLAEFYQNKKRDCIAAADKYLKDVAEWNEPAGGLFMWIKMKVKDSMPLINKAIKDKNVFAVPGVYFMLDANTPCPYIRVAFSNSNPEELKQAFQSISEVVKDHWSKNGTNTPE